MEPGAGTPHTTLAVPAPPGTGTLRQFALPLWAWAAGPPVSGGLAFLLALGYGRTHPVETTASLLRPILAVLALAFAANMVATPISYGTRTEPVPASPLARRLRWWRVFRGTALRLLAFLATAAITDFALRSAAGGVAGTSVRDGLALSAMAASVLAGAAISLMLHFTGPLGRRGALAAAGALVLALVIPHVVWGVVYNLTLLGQVAALWGPPSAASLAAAAASFAVWRVRPSGAARPASASLFAALTGVLLAGIAGAAASGAWASGEPSAGWRAPRLVSSDQSGGVSARVALSNRDGAPHAWIEGQGRRLRDLGRHVGSVALSPDGSRVAWAQRLGEVELWPFRLAGGGGFFFDRARLCAASLPTAGPVCSAPLEVASSAVGAVNFQFHPRLPRVVAVGTDHVWAADLPSGRQWTRGMAAGWTALPCWVDHDRVLLAGARTGRHEVLDLRAGRVDHTAATPVCLDSEARIPAPHLHGPRDGPGSVRP